MKKHQEEPQEQQNPKDHVNPAKHEGAPDSDVQGNKNASVNPFTRGGAHKTSEQNPSRNDGAHRAPMGRDAGKDPQKVTPIRKNPQGNNPMSKDV
jgi:hypothetical protein